MLEEDREKTSKIRKTMEKEGLDVLVLHLTEDIVYGSGYWPFQGSSYLMLFLDAEPALVCHAHEEPYPETGWVKDVKYFPGETPESFPSEEAVRKKLIETAEERKVAKGTMGFEGSMEFVSTSFLRHKVQVSGIPSQKFLETTFPDFTLRDASAMIYKLRSVKTQKEIEQMKLVNRIADSGMETFRSELSAGKTEFELAAEVERAVTLNGFRNKKTDRVVAFAFVMSGPRSVEAYKYYDVHTTKKIRRGEPVLLELNVCVDGYWADLSHTYGIGLSKNHRKLIEDVRQANDVGVKAAGAGARAAEVNNIAYDHLKAAGYQKYFRHRLGHGIGCIVHELPALHVASDDMLETGMVFSIEPGIYVPGFGGIRMEDNVLATESGGFRLSHYSKELT